MTYNSGLSMFTYENSRAMKSMVSIGVVTCRCVVVFLWVRVRVHHVGASVGAMMGAGAGVDAGVGAGVGACAGEMCGERACTCADVDVGVYGQHFLDVHNIYIYT